MSLATLSPEMQIKNRLRALGCSENEFSAYNCFVTKTKFYNALRGEKSLSREEAERVLGLITEMESLQKDCGLPIRWADHDTIEIALVLRRVQSIALDLYEDHRFDQQAEQATGAVAKQ